MPNPSIFTSIINSYLPEPHASLLNGIIFGVDLKTTKVFYEQLKIVGLLHLVVLSGINITMLVALVSYATNFLGKFLSGLITILTIIFFIIFVGPKAPIIRAGFMGVLTFVSIVLGRKNLALYSLFLSAIFISIFCPKWLTTVSFQLSYGATLGIILFGRVEEKKSKDWSSKLKTDIWKDIKLSLSAQLFTAPIIFFYFKQISLIAPLSNLLVSFLIPPLMVFGFLTAILGKINFWLGSLFAYICYGILSYMVFIIEILSKLPFIYFKF
jgi:competence protein ComEC